MGVEGDLGEENKKEENMVEGWRGRTDGMGDWDVFQRIVCVAVLQFTVCVCPVVPVPLVPLPPRSAVRCS